MRGSKPPSVSPGADPSVQSIQEQLLRREGSPFTAAEVATLLNISIEQVDTRRKVGSLLAISLRDQGHFFPSWQFSKSQLLPGLEEVLEDLRNHDPLAKLWFFLSGDFRLEGATPLEELRHGNVEKVREAASAYGEHGAV